MKNKENKPTETPQQAKDRTKEAGDRARKAAAMFAEIRARVMGRQ